MPRALILSYHFYPSREVGAKRVSELACRLREAGWEVTVIAAPPQDRVAELAARIEGMDVSFVPPPGKIYPRVARLLRRRKQQTATTQPSAGAERVHEKASRESGWRALWRNYNALEWTLDDRKWWAGRVARQALRRRTRWDWIISSGPPVSIHVAARVVAGITGSRWLMDLRDPWFGNEFWPAHVRSTLRDRIERALERACVSRADRITVASPGIGHALLRRVPAAAPRLQVVLNGFDGEPATGPGVASGRLRLLYAGTLYFNRDPFPLLEALRDLLRTPGIERRRVSFTLVGNCREWNGRALDAWVREEGLEECVRILAPVPPAGVAALMRETEVLVNFAQGQPDQIPAKLYDYIASGRETLLIAERDSDAARITRESETGRIVEPGDGRGLRLALRELYEFYVERRQAFLPPQTQVENYSRRRQNSRFLELLAAPSAGG